MSTVQERDFADFQLGDNPIDLANGVLQEVAKPLGIDLRDGTDPEPYGRLVGALGPDKVLRNNRDLRDIWSPDEAADLVERSGIQKPLNRSIWTPDIKSPENADLIATGGVPNWMTRTGGLIAKQPGNGKVWLPTGNRVMNTKTDQANANVQQFYSDKGRYPTESEYQERYIAPNIERAGREVQVIAYDTANGDQIAQRFVADHPELFAEGKEISCARVANAGIMQAVQVRKAARAANASYDADSSSPQIYVVTDTLQVARTEEQLKDPVHYQSADTALRQLGVTGKMLAESLN